MITRIKNGKLILPDGICENKYLYFEHGKITAITSEELSFDTEIDAHGNYVSPGFIDLHLHGGGGHRYIGLELLTCESFQKIHDRFLLSDK